MPSFKACFLGNLKMPYSSNNEVKLFNAFSEAINQTNGISLITHQHYVNFDIIQSTPYPTKSKRCEISDLLLIFLDEHCLRYSFIQMKKMKSSEVTPTTFNISINPIQWYLLAKRPDIFSSNRRFPIKTLSSALLPSVGSHGDFYIDSKSNMNLRYFIAELAKPTSSFDLTNRLPKTFKVSACDGSIKNTGIGCPVYECPIEHLYELERDDDLDSLIDYGRQMKVGTPLFFDDSSDKDFPFDSTYRYRSEMINLLGKIFRSALIIDKKLSPEVDRQSLKNKIVNFLQKTNQTYLVKEPKYNCISYAVIGSATSESCKCNISTTESCNCQKIVNKNGKESLKNSEETKMEIQTGHAEMAQFDKFVKNLGKKYGKDYFSINQDGEYNLAKALNPSLDKGQYIQAASEQILFNTIKANTNQSTGTINHDIQCPKTNSKDVDIVYIGSPYSLYVEVKTPQLFQDSPNFKSGTVYGELDHRYSNDESIKDSSNRALADVISLFGGKAKAQKMRDNKLKDYLISANNKMPNSNDCSLNVLAICLDSGEMGHFLYYIMNEQTGLFSKEPYLAKDKYSKIDFIVLSNCVEAHLDSNFKFNVWDGSNYIYLVIPNRTKSVSQKKNAFLCEVFSDKLGEYLKKRDCYIMVDNMRLDDAFGLSTFLATEYPQFTPNNKKRRY